MQERKFANSSRQRPDGRKPKGRAIKHTTSPSKPPNPIDVTSFEAQHDITAVQVKDTLTVDVQRRPLADYATLSGEVGYAG
jgi:hypothetical protein